VNKDALPKAGGVTIRPARPDDYAAISDLWRMGGEGLPPFLTSAKAFESGIEMDGVYLAFADDDALGILSTSPIAYDGDRPYTLWVEAIFVHPNWRRHGIGVALYHALGVWARAAGAHAVLTARHDDPGISALHRRVGFVAHRDDLLLWRFEE
jgi:GNAT superfamily N-acetyltransferase